MPKPFAQLAALTFLAGAVFTTAAQADEVHRGQLAQGDPTTEVGTRQAYYDRYEITTQPGQVVRFDLVTESESVVDLQRLGDAVTRLDQPSRPMDAYLIAISPGDVLYEARAYRGDPAHAHFEMLDLDGGTWTLIVTSTSPDAAGPYRLNVTTEPGSLGDPVRAEADELGHGDRIVNLHFIDTFELDIEAGDRVLVDVTSRSFDTVLTLNMPDGRTLENDDFLGAINHSRLALLATESGTMTIEVKSFDAQGEGSYLLRAYADESGIAHASRDVDAPQR